MNYKFNFLEQQRCLYGEGLVTPLSRLQHCAFITPTVPKGFETSKPKYRSVLCFQKELDGKELELYNKMVDMGKAMFEFLTEKLWTIDTKAKRTKSTLDAYRAEYNAQMKYRLFRDGDTSGDYEGYENAYLISANIPSQNKHGVLLKATDRCIFMNPKNPEEYENGMLVRAQVQPCLGAQGFSYSLQRIRVELDDGVRYGSAGPDLLSDVESAVRDVTMALPGEEVEPEVAQPSTPSKARSTLDVL